MWLTDDELAEGAASQEWAWNVGGSRNNSTQRDAPAYLAEDRSVADHQSALPEGG